MIGREFVKTFLNVSCTVTKYIICSFNLGGSAVEMKLSLKSEVPFILANHVTFNSKSLVYCIANTLHSFFSPTRTTNLGAEAERSFFFFGGGGGGGNLSLKTFLRCS